MEDVGRLDAFRNVLLAPLTPLTRTLKERSAEGRSVSSSGYASSLVSLHDHHNIEVKTVSELTAAPSLVETDYYLFVPKNFELSGHGKMELVKDFRSRVRLAVPVGGAQGPAALSEALITLRYQLDALGDAEKSGEDVNDLNHALCEQVLETAKDIAAILAETLKHRTAESTRRLLLSHSLIAIPSTALAGLEQLRSDLDGTLELLSMYRSSITKCPQSAAAILSFLDEYLSHLYIQFLSSIRAEFLRIATPKSAENDLPYLQARNKMEICLNSLQEKEAQHRLKFSARANGADGSCEAELDREQRLVRLSHLKKFFQSKTFVDITRQQPATKLSESTATIATACAGIMAAILEFYGRHAVAEAAFQGLFVLSFGVIVYVFRDRLKDWAKTIFHKKALQFLPDFEQRLMAKETRIGRVKEWFRIMKSKEVPLDVLSLRRASASSELERRLPEDVFHCRKIQEVYAASLAESGKPTQTRALYDNTRVNFERYLKHMDDAFKDLTDLDPSGRFLSSRSHRVYHFYLCVKTITGQLDNSMTGKFIPNQVIRETFSTQTLLYRIVLDKNGVVRLENLEKS